MQQELHTLIYFIFLLPLFFAHLSPLPLSLPLFPVPLSGSSAGAGSEVFHVYRHLRRRENMRQQHIQENAEKDDLDEEFQEKLARNMMADDERTSKKRAKRYNAGGNW